MGACKKKKGTKKDPPFFVDSRKEKKTDKMILLEVENRIMVEAIKARFASTRREAVDISFADFDGVSFHLCTDANARNIVTVSISWRCINDLRGYGLETRLRAVYGDLYQSTPRTGFDVSLQFDLDKYPDEAAQLELAHKIALLKRHVFAVPFQ